MTVLLTTLIWPQLLALTLCLSLIEDGNPMLWIIIMTIDTHVMDSKID